MQSTPTSPQRFVEQRTPRRRPCTRAEPVDEHSRATVDLNTHTLAVAIPLGYARRSPYRLCEQRSAYRLYMRSGRHTACLCEAVAIPHVQRSPYRLYMRSCRHTAGVCATVAIPLEYVQRSPYRSCMCSGRLTACPCAAVALPLEYVQRSPYRLYMCSGRHTA